MDGFWEFVDAKGLDPNPYRAGFLQLVAVSETDASAEEDYYEHIRYFYDKSLHIAPESLRRSRLPGLPEPGEYVPKGVFRPNNLRYPGNERVEIPGLRR